MEVRAGYKQTEVGVIPTDWEVTPLSDVAEFLDGKRRPVKDTDRAKMRGDIPYYGASGIVDYVNDFLFDEDLILLGEDGENILSRNCRLAFKITGKTWVNNHAHVLRSKPGMSLDYLAEFLESKDYKQYNTGTAQPKLNKVVCSGIPVLAPPLPEQRAIAAALSDADALLEGLTRLIAKKRDLKQAAMQQLLTGQTRLPGFHGEWEVKRLIQAAEISTGINKPLSEMGRGALYVTVQDLYDGTSIRTNGLSRIKVSSAEIEARALVAGDIVFGKSSVKREGIGYPSQFLGCAEPVVFSGFTYRARARKGIADATFLFYALRTGVTRHWVIDNSQASALTNINQKIADAIPIQLPPTVPEQTAIATVLSDMDAELAALEARRDKTRALKQAMMQELLTGRTRLA